MEVLQKALYKISSKDLSIYDLEFYELGRFTNSAKKALNYVRNSRVKKFIYSSEVEGEILKELKDGLKDTARGIYKIVKGMPNLRDKEWWKRNWKKLAFLGAWYGGLITYEALLQVFFFDQPVREYIFNYGFIPKNWSLFPIPYRWEPPATDWSYNVPMLIDRPLTEQEIFVRDWVYAKPVVPAILASIPPLAKGVWYVYKKK